MLLNPHSDRHGHVFALATQKCFLSGPPGSLVMTPDGFSALLFAQLALEKKKKKRFYTAFCHLIL